MRELCARLLRFSVCVVVTPLLATAPGQRTPLDDILDRAALYVVKYEKECSAVVAEEHYVQEVRSVKTGSSGFAGAVGDAHPSDEKRLWDDGPTSSRQKAPSGPTRRELLSDVLMVQLPDQTWVGFRDVAAVNGKPVRDRAERLQALFLGTPAGLKKVQRESARYNIGPIDRTMNLPTFALAYLHPALRHRFAFQLAGEETIDGIRTAVVAFVEQARPTIINNGRGGSIVSRGRAWIDPATGRVLRTRLLAGDGSTEHRAESEVRYRLHAEWDLMLPASMSESVEQVGRVDAVRIVGSATYTNFRRFQVTVEEKAQVPKEPGR